MIFFLRRFARLHLTLTYELPFTALGVCDSASVCDSDLGVCVGDLVIVLEILCLVLEILCLVLVILCLCSV